MNLHWRHRLIRIFISIETMVATFIFFESNEKDLIKTPSEGFTPKILITIFQGLVSAEADEAKIPWKITDTSIPVTDSNQAPEILDTRNSAKNFERTPMTLFYESKD